MLEMDWIGSWKMARKGRYISVCSKQTLFFHKKYSYSFKSIYTATDIALIKVPYFEDVFAYFAQHDSEAYLESCKA